MGVKRSGGWLALKIGKRWVKNGASIGRLVRWIASFRKKRERLKNLTNVKKFDGSSNYRKLGALR